MEGPDPDVELITTVSTADVCWRCGHLSFGCLATGRNRRVLWFLCHGCIGKLVNTAYRVGWRRGWEIEPRRRAPHG